MQQPCSCPSFPWLLPGGRNPKHEVWLYNRDTYSMTMVTKPQTAQRTDSDLLQPRDRQQPSQWSLGTDSSSDPDWSCLVFPSFICFWPMQGPVMISALEGDNIIPQFATWDANMRNKLGDDLILTTCRWNSWGPVVFTEIKNACQALSVRVLLFSLQFQPLLFAFFF